MAWTVAASSNYGEFSAGLAHGDGNDTIRCFLDISTIPPGESKRGILSLRFGPPTSGILDLAGDAYQRHDAWAPFQFQWPDRRAIGRIFLAEPPPHPADGRNPRGWCQNNDHDLKAQQPWSRQIRVIDRLTGKVDPQGYPKFREEMLKAVDARLEAAASQPWYFKSKPMQRHEPARHRRLGYRGGGIPAYDHLRGRTSADRSARAGNDLRAGGPGRRQPTARQRSAKKYRCLADEIFYRIRHKTQLVEGKAVSLNLRSGSVSVPQTLQNLAVRDNPGKPEMEHYPKWWLVQAGGPAQRYSGEVVPGDRVCQSPLGMYAVLYRFDRQ